MPHALLLQPPPGDLTGPYAAAAYLKASAQQDGFEVRIHDLGIEAFHFLSTPEQVRLRAAQTDNMRQRLEAKGALEPIELRWYGLLLMAKGFGQQPDLIQKAIDGLRDERSFYDYAQYKLNCKILDGFFRLLRAVAYPTMTTPTSYPSAHALKTMEAIALHLDRAFNPYIDFYEEVLLPKIADTRPAIIGISMTYASQSVQALVLGMLIKKRFPHVHVTMGGAYLTQWSLLMDEERLAELLACTDSVIFGEGEVPLSQLLDHITRGRSLDGLPNLIHRDGHSQVRRSESMVFSDLTQQAPPDYSDLDLSAYLIPEPVLPYVLTRGCYWHRCAFCQNRIGGFRPRPYQTVPVDQAVAELSALAIRNGTRHFHFCGDVIDPDYLNTFCNALLAAETPVRWNTNLRAEKAIDREFALLLRKAGLNSVAIGFESGCSKTLDAMDKGTPIEVVAQVLRNLYQAGVATQITGFFGFPGESESEASLTVDFLMEHGDFVSSFDFGLLMVWPGSRMHDQGSQFGVDRISYRHNPLSTPEPIWHASRRLPMAALDRLYERLGMLEASAYLINDHPYVGALCSNHSMLYFTLGPDILKHLRAVENLEHQAVHQTFGLDERHRAVGQVQQRIPRLALPYEIYRSPYPHERSHFSTAVERHPQRLLAGAGWDYLLDPINVPLRVGPAERRILDHIDGHRDLATIAKAAGGTGDRSGIQFLIRLVLTGLVQLLGSRIPPGQTGHDATA